MDMIDLLETVGRDASLRAASQEELRQALRCAGADDALIQAMLDEDERRLADALDLSLCKTPQHVILQPGHEPPSEEPDGQEQEAPSESRDNATGSH
ncbi:hypothetical protein V5738_02030 [Salinisphaera sp. SPP-AMP-43]|uniref:hypothetical protein n=1 Tax=Salinisphaera sp. SPP-AMP-43 TaxID=3121288 RepID=UPI003C6E5401